MIERQATTVARVHRRLKLVEVLDDPKEAVAASGGFGGTQRP
ncbi:MAG: hypothetical protein P8J37_01840 [Fuerstiella sp.]|nr:hypothetical protein [Fuerstiella sp.]